MKTNSFFLWASLVLASGCGDDAASKKLAADTEARVIASIKQVLVQNMGQGDALAPVHTWYQSEVPNIIKLDPNAAAVYQVHAAIMKEAATHRDKLAGDSILSPTQAQGIRTKYDQLVQESTANVSQLTNLASSPSTMSEAEQRQFVATLAGKQRHQLQLMQYYTKRTASTIDLKNRQRKSQDYNLKLYGHY